MPARSDALIDISGCSKVYPRGPVTVFEDFNLQIRRNEIVTIVGPSGCGKTTLLRCLNGLIPLTSGTIRIDDERVEGPHPRMAMVFQHFGLLPWQTVEKNVAFGLRMKGVPKAEWRDAAARCIDVVGLTGFERSYPFHLSGGMRQRVGLARALAVEPDVLLMDEPFASVDAQTRETLQRELLTISEARPITMIFITHSIEEALLMGDRIVVLSPRPARVRRVIDVPFERPRDVDSVVGDPLFAALRQEIWHLLGDKTAPALGSQ
jgi:NitT/TauT family transport system ATP-binding protein